MKAVVKIIIWYCSVLCLIQVSLGVGASVVKDGDALLSFTTGGHTVYHLQCADIGANVTAIVGACYDGAVVCYTSAGERVWINEKNDGFPLDLATADIDNDGLDEALIAYADGKLVAIDHDGKLLWTFERPAPLIQVCVVNDPKTGPVILTGGAEKILFALTAKGVLRGSHQFEYLVRHIRAGNIRGDGRQYAAVVINKNDKSRCILHLIDPVNLKPVWEKPTNLTTRNPTTGTKIEVEWLGNRAPVYSMLIADLDGDGRDEIALTSGFDKLGVYNVYNGDGKKISQSEKAPSRRSAYRMNLIAHGRTGEGERVVGIFGNELLVYRFDGKVEHSAEGPYAFTSLAFDDKSSICYLGSSVAGGDGIHLLHLDDPGWKKAYREIKGVGRITEVQSNLEKLAQQVAAFKRPAYQKAPRATRVITGRDYDEIRKLFLADADYANVKFSLFTLFTEDFDRSTLEGIWKKKRESRHKYNFTAKEIIGYCAEREKRKEPFSVWAGHGNDPFYMQLSTIEGMIKVAPTMLKALVFSEMERTDEDMAYAVQQHILPIADMCRKQRTTKIILRCKNVFWNASYRLKLWGPTLLGGKYSDIFIPSMEETNGRTQALSLSGRTGLWLAGYFDYVSTRVVTDNACYSRLWEYGAQQTQSHLLRALVLGASLGSDTFLVNIYQGDQRDLAPFYRMIEKGVIAIPDPESLLSVNEVCLGMRQPSGRFLEHGKNGHSISFYKPREPPAVFDRMDCYWGGAPTADYDFSRYAMGSQRRMLNFLPPNPYGMIVTVPEEADLKAIPHLRTMLETDGEVFYDQQGKAVSAPAFKQRAEEVLRKGASRLPVLVRGEVAWTVVRIDSTHVRITLIDSGYIDPADRDAEIVLQHIKGVGCTDILRREALPLNGNIVRLTVPAGSLRVVDIAHY
ncbi:MAG: hypothetical protein PF904_21110 [Kiritimatiellae bacterium]|jgi:hypothetical protein|nr:hypothetical protein [Kiritimatiellia bacterium]